MRRLAVLASTIVILAAWTDRSPHRDGFTTTGDVRIHYLTWGSSSASRPALLLIPGLDQTAHIFDDLAPALSSSFRVIAIDRRGHGRSDAPPPRASGNGPNRYAVEVLADDLVRVLDSAHVSRAIVIGHSFGGLEVTALAASHRDRVRAAIYLDAAYDYTGMTPIWSQDPVHIAPKPADLASFDASKRWFVRVFGFWSDAVEADARAANLQADGTMQPTGLKPDVAEALGETLTTTTPDFTAVRVPTLAFYAVSSTHPFLSRDAEPAVADEANRFWRDVYSADQQQQIARFARDVPGAVIVRLEQTPHLCFLRPADQARVVRELRTFIDRL